jgi:hypothetical protein
MKKIEYNGKLCKIVTYNEYEMTIELPPGQRCAPKERKTISMNEVKPKMRASLLKKI